MIRSFRISHCIACLFLLLASAGVSSAAETADPKLLEAFLKAQTFERVKLSPDGAYLAITVPVEDRTVLAVIQRSDRKVVGSFGARGKTHVANFWWVSDKRIVLSLAERDGLLEVPSLTGELYATDFDGKNQTILTGYRSGEQQLGTAVKKRTDPFVISTFVGTIKDNPLYILAASTHAFSTSEVGFTTLDRLDVRSGVRTKLSQVPVTLADFIVDHQGQPRFAMGTNKKGFQQLYYRAGANGEWQLINDEQTDKHREFALGFNTDDSVAYLQVEEAKGPDGIYSYDTRSGKRQLLARDERVDPSDVLYMPDGVTPFAVTYSDGKQRAHYLDESSPQARFMQSLQVGSFPDAAVDYVNASADNNLLLFRVHSDRDPGSYYLVDTRTKKADYLMARQEWLDPEAMASVQAIEFKARDGMVITGLLTLPHGHSKGPLPMIVNPHGGPIGVADTWGFDLEPQLLAAHGYAVLQVNYRGSSNRGREFEAAGFGQWGAAILDDITDATHWAISQGHADAKRICIYGGSYGGYAALMGAARESGLYRCAAGYVGVYDLSSFRQQTDVGERESGRMYFAQMFGGKSPETLKDWSPTTLAAHIRVPVFLASGGKDERAPEQQSEAMRDSLKQAGNPPQWLNYPTEGHGFYKKEHRQELYTQLLNFFGRNLSSEPNTTAVGASAGK